MKEKKNNLCSYCHKRKVHAKGFCNNCYSRYLKNGKPDRIKVCVEKKCLFCGEFGFIKAKGLCNKCYSRFLKTGSPEYTKFKNVAICVFCGEEKEIKAKGLCSSCYQRTKKNGTPEYKKTKKICSIDGCVDFVVSNRLCDKHYRRWKRHGHTGQTRPKGWGSKEKHPLYNIWCWQKRKTAKSKLSTEWLDFWKFVNDVGEKPSQKHKFCIINPLKPINKENYEWVEWESGGADKEKIKQYVKRWREDNEAKTQDMALKKHYGISIDDYEKMYDQQNGVCAICGNPEFAKTNNGKVRKLAVDHCHDTGKIRGLLCTNCNKGIGHLKDSQRRLTKAIEYLKQNT